MLYIDGNTIRLTRGDTAYIQLSVDNGMEEYEIRSTDVITLTLKKSVKDSAILMQKQLTGSSTFRIEPQDTSALRFGRYVYDIQLKTASGDIYTVVEPSIFEIMPEVTWQ